MSANEESGKCLGEGSGDQNYNVVSSGANCHLDASTNGIACNFGKRYVVFGDLITGQDCVGSCGKVVTWVATRAVTSVERFCS